MQSSSQHFFFFLNYWNVFLFVYFLIIYLLFICVDVASYNECQSLAVVEVLSEMRGLHDKVVLFFLKILWPLGSAAHLTQLGQHGL